MDHKQKLSGVFAPVVTPFVGDVPDLDALAHNLARFRKTNLTGFLALGSNGEYKSLTDEERLLVLDVFTQEPLPPDSPLWDEPRILLTAHIAGASPRYEERATDLFLENLRLYLAGQELFNIHDPERGY